MNAKQSAFVREYLVDLNATQAARRAGYSEKTAHSQGQRLLKNADVSRAVERAQTKRAERVEVKADDVLRELMRIGFSDLADIFTEAGQLRGFRDIPEATRRAVAAIKVKSHTEPGDEETVVWTTEFKLWDKNAALTNLAKHLRLLTEIVAHTFDGQTDEQLEKKLGELLARQTGPTIAAPQLPSRDAAQP